MAEPKTPATDEKEGVDAKSGGARSTPPAPWDEWSDFACCYVCNVCGAAEGFRFHGIGCRHAPWVQLSVTWAELLALHVADVDGTGQRLLDAARTFLSAEDVGELLRCHRAGIEIRVLARRVLPERRITPGVQSP